MSLKSKIKKIFKFKKNVVTPVYIPCILGDLLKNKTVLITGGSSGIGYAIAESCVKCGANVIICGRNEMKLESAAAKLVRNASGTISTFCLDISRDVESLDITDVMAKTKVDRIDAFVNNAGVGSTKTLGDTSISEWDNVMQTNLKGTYFLLEKMANYFVSNGIKGNILNISSVSGGRPAISPYMISKCGINGLTKGAAKKYIKYGVVVNAIAPGPTATDMINASDSNLDYERCPAGRYVTPAEVANIAVILISEMGRMIVGETIAISGGCGTLTYDDIKY